MATARMTFGTVLGTVSEAAVAVSTVLGAGIKTVNMLDKYVSDAATKQEIRSIVEMESFEVRLQEEVAIEDTERQVRLQGFRDKSTEHERLFKANFDRIGKLLAERRGQHWKPSQSDPELQVVNA